MDDERSVNEGVAGDSRVSTGIVSSVMHDRALPWLILLVAGGAWGSTFSLAKIATQGGAHPLSVNMWGAVIGALVMALVNVARRRRVPLGRRHLVFYAVAGMLGTVVPNTLFFYAAPHVSAGVLSISIAIVPIVTLALAVGIGIDRISVGRVVGVLLGITAVLMLVVPDGSLSAPSAAVWVLVALGACACYALENVYIAVRLPQGSDALVVLCGMLCFASLVLVPGAFLTGTFSPLAFAAPTSVDLAIVAIALVNVFSYASFVHLVALAGPVFASQMAYTVTLSGVIWGLVIFAEQHTAWVWGSLVVMLIGVTLVKPKESDQPSG